MNEKWCMRFKMKYPEGDAYDGIVISNLKTHIILRQFKDFEAGGILILPKKYIKGYCDGDSEKCSNSIIEENGQKNNIDVPQWVTSCVNIREVIRELKKHEIWPSVETISNEGKDTVLYIGAILECLEKEFFLHCYDGSGKWEKEYLLDYGNITVIRFGDKYTMHFNKYMKNLL